MELQKKLVAVGVVDARECKHEYGSKLFLVVHVRKP
jgi:hypothetical protein